MGSARLVEETSAEIARHCRRLFGVEEDINYGALSPFVPYTLYQSAVIQLQLLKRFPKSEYEDNVQILKRVLRSFNKRWLVAGKSKKGPHIQVEADDIKIGKYLKELQADCPPLLLPPT